MKRDVVLVVFILLAVAVSTHAFFLDQNQITGQATEASLSFCLNQPPVLDISACNFTLQQNKYFACSLNTSDFDGDVDFSYFSQNISSRFNFNVTDAGVLIAQPDDDLVGFHTVDLLTVDTSGCANNADIERVTVSVINVNDPPVYVPPLGPFEFQLGETLRSIFLDSYFFDPDGDDIRYTISNPDANFLLTLVQPPELILTASACGESSFIVTATDTFNASTSTPPIELAVPCVEEEQSSAGGGGGGDSCQPNWQCSDWGTCYENGTQKKTCNDIAECEDDELIFWRNCTYVPQCENGVQDLNEEGIDCGGPCPICETCFDGIQNQGELGVDCGGPCPICQNCFDGIRNFDEVGVDCGGPCPACPSCFDGVQNQDETGIDCGGSCPACTVLQTPNPVQESSNPLLAWVLGIIATLGVLALLYRFFYKKIHAFIAKLILHFLPRANKAILLSKDQKLTLLDELSSLERKDLLHNSQKEQRAKYQDELGAILRKLVVIIVGPVFTTQDADESIEKLSVAKPIKHLLHKIYVQLESLEQDGVMQNSRLYLHTELLRQNIYGFAESETIDTDREVTRKKIKGSSVEQVEALLHNVFVALQFGNVSAAQKSYIQALAIYDGMTAPEQALMFSLLHLSFDQIKYVRSFTR